MSAVTLRDVTKRFSADRAALDAVSLRVEPGEFLALVGPSGCGKTTILRCIAGLEQPTTGTITIGARDVTDLPPQQRDVAMVFQNYALYPHLTVRENIGFPLSMRRLPREDIRRRVLDAALALGIELLLNRRPGELSGGERQRAALARAIVREPAAFLFDEPLSNLDAALRTGMRAELAALHRRLGATVLYVTHDQTEAMTLGQRIAVLATGQVQQVGTPRELYERPANRFVAGFLGSPGMNLLPASLIGGTAGATTLGVRPEHVDLGAPGTGLRGRVRLVEPLGADTLVHVVCAGDAAVVVRQRGDATPPAVDAEVGITVAEARWHRFDAAGARC